MKNTLWLIILTTLFSISVFSQSPTETEETDAANSALLKAEEMVREAASEKKVKETSENENNSGPEQDLPVELSLDIFNMIEPDMSYDLDKELIGAEGIITSHTKSGSVESVVYEWKGDKNARILVEFQNGKLVSKSQSKLTGRDGIDDIDQSKFDQLKTGMSYYEVLAIIGVEGEMTRLSRSEDSTTISYTWKGPKFARIIVTFRNDVVSDKTQTGLPK